MTSLQVSVPAISLGEEDRGTFVIKVYQHVAAAAVAFFGFEVLLFATGTAERMFEFFLNGIRWVLLVGGAMIGNWIVTSAARIAGNPARQYVSLLAKAGLEALVFAPFLFALYEVYDNPGSTIGAAALLAAVGFALLVAIGVTTRKDISATRPLIMWGLGFAAVFLVGAVLFGFNPGVGLPAATIGALGIATLSQAQAVIRTHAANAYVPAAISLFGALATERSSSVPSRGDEHEVIV